MLWGAADGEMGLPFFIIKCSPTKADLSSTRVVHNMQRCAGFKEADGWSLKIWQRELELQVKQQMVKILRPYLIHFMERSSLVKPRLGWTQQMTDQLQIMDLVVNAPVKSAIRRDRIQRLFTYFQTWKCQRMQAEQ
ncbi:MAG: hypothetical protein SGPRY_010433 [Prymnesium sp.]